ncbi:MAG: biotin/lipoyl-containing protein [Oscillospiraceae bacterium]
MKQLKITVNGKSYDVQVEEMGATAAPATVAAAAAPIAAPIAAPAPTQAPPAAPAPVAVSAGEGDPINCPMPGTIVKVLVTAGQAVKRGDILLILEAMKMENEICAPNDGTVVAVSVAAGEAVDSGKLLLTLK